MFVQGGDAGREGPGKGAGAVHHPLEHGGGFQVPGDAPAGLAQAGEALPQGRVIPEQHVGIHPATPPDRKPPDGTAGCGFQPVVATRTCIIGKMLPHSYFFDVTNM